MEPLEIVSRLKDKFLSEIVNVKEFRDQVFVTVKRERISDICRFLFSDPDIHMNFLADLCGADYPDREERFEVVYNLSGL